MKQREDIKHSISTKKSSTKWGGDFSRYVKMKKCTCIFEKNHKKQDLCRRE